MDRRECVLAIGGVGLATVAGCLGSREEISQGEAEDAVEAYIDAIRAEDPEQVKQAINPEGAPDRDLIDTDNMAEVQIEAYSFSDEYVFGDVANSFDEFVDRVGRNEFWQDRIKRPYERDLPDDVSVAFLPVQFDGPVTDQVSGVEDLWFGTDNYHDEIRVSQIHQTPDTDIDEDP